MRLWISVAVFGAVLVLITVNFLRTRRRGTSIAKTLRPDASEFISLQDDLLGRPHTAGATSSSAGPVATLFEDRGDPLQGLNAPAPRELRPTRTDTGDPAALDAPGDEAD
ncbi:hypothetical protein CSO01_11430 [Cellulomonas soli]|uniref:Uncharacterized protein n=1 Tax=Cellulomonas soli TaxID=931535 RepID=A0A512PB58_9CELL|nr:hypothetical protein [Cellulomonas soli]GEP68428.1 hypothetical protein CSO01_11430 [Cellulomonas soli]